MMQAVIKRKRIARDSLNWESPPEEFLAFKEKAGFMTGFIQGCEYILNDVRAGLAEEQSVRENIKQIEKELRNVTEG